MTAATVHRVARRYEPVIVALAVSLAVMHFVDPIPFQIPGALGIAPFRATPSGVTDPGTGTSPAAEETAAPSDAPAPLPPGAVVVERAPAPAATDQPVSVAAPPPEPAPAAPGPSAANPVTTLFARHPAPGGAGGVAVVGDRVIATLADGGAGLAVLSTSGELQRTITVSAKGLAGATARGTGEVLVAASNPASLLAVDVASGRARRLASIPDVAQCIPVIRDRDCDAAPLDAAPRPWAVAEGPGGAIFVVDAGQGAIWQVPRGGGKAQQWLVDPTFATPGDAAGPVGVAFDSPRRELVVALPRRLTADRGEVLAIKVGRDGAAGAQRTIATLADGEHAGGLTIDPRGTILLTLPSSRQLLALDRQGKELRRTSIDAGLGAGEPTGMSLIGQSDVLVALRRTGDAATTSIVRIAGVRRSS